MRAPSAGASACTPVTLCAQSSYLGASPWWRGRLAMRAHMGGGPARAQAFARGAQGQPMRLFRFFFVRGLPHRPERNRGLAGLGAASPPEEGGRRSHSSPAHRKRTWSGAKGAARATFRLGVPGPCVRCVLVFEPRRLSSFYHNAPPLPPPRLASTPAAFLAMAVRARAAPVPTASTPKTARDRPSRVRRGGMVGQECVSARALTSLTARAPSGTGLS